MTKSFFQIETKKSNFHVSVGNITQTEIPKLAFLRLIGTDFNITEWNEWATVKYWDETTSRPEIKRRQRLPRPKKNKTKQNKTKQNKTKQNKTKKNQETD